MKLHRTLFDWEGDQWNSFLLSLQNIIVRRDIPDVLAWSFCLNGSFSVNSFRKALERTRRSNDGFECSFLWKGICPPKVEVFMFQLFKGRILVKSVLNNFSMAQMGSLDCPLCSNNVESIDHLFLVSMVLGVVV